MKNNDEAAILIAIFGGVCFAMLAFLAAAIFYLKTLSKCFARISRRNRRMDPGQVWLNLIPFFNTVWMPITLDRLTESLRDEYDDLRIDDPGDGFGRPFWIAYLVLFTLAAIPYLGVCPGFIGLVIWIVYWVKLAAYSRQLAAGRRDDDEYEDDDPADRPPPRRRVDDRDPPPEDDR
jgi:hypothetical protein